MNATEYRRAIKRLDLNQSSIAVLLDIDPSTSRRYAASQNDPSRRCSAAAHMVKRDISADEARALIEWPLVFMTTYKVINIRPSRAASLIKS